MTMADLDRDPIAPVRVVIAADTVTQLNELTGIKFGPHRESGVPGFIGGHKDLARLAAWCGEVLGMADTLLMFASLRASHQPGWMGESGPPCWQFTFPGVEVL